MRAEIKRRLKELDIRIIGWGDQWDPLAAQWICESFPEYDPDNSNNVLVTEWFRSMKADSDNTFYAITSHGKPIGIGAIVTQNPILRSAECHLFLDESMANRGIGHLIALNTFDMLFDNGFETLTIKPKRDNFRAVNTAKKLGFKESKDIIPMELTKDSWRNNNSYMAIQKSEELKGENYG